MRYLILSLTFILSSCASTQTSGYISRADHPYERKIYAGFEKVVSTTLYVLKQKGWMLDSEVAPSVFERDDRYDNNGYRNLLIITEIKKNALHLTGAHLNIFIHSIGETCDVEIRYEATTSLLKQFTSVRNDQIVQDILDSIEQEAK